MRLHHPMREPHGVGRPLDQAGSATFFKNSFTPRVKGLRPAPYDVGTGALVRTKGESPKKV